MKRRLVTIFLGACVLASVVALSDFAVESYYVYRLGSPVAAVRHGAVRKLGAMRSSRAVRPLLELLDREATLHPMDMSISHPAGEALKEIGEPAVPRLTAALESGRPAVKAHVLDILRAIGRPARSALSLVREIVYGENEDLHFGAVVAMVKIADIQTVRAELCNVLVKGSDSGQMAAVYEINRRGPEASWAVRPLIRFLRSDGKHEYARQGAALALLDLRPLSREEKRAIDQLIVSEENPFVRGALEKMSDSH